MIGWYYFFLLLTKRSSRSNSFTRSLGLLSRKWSIPAATAAPRHIAVFSRVLFEGISQFSRQVI